MYRFPYLATGGHLALVLAITLSGCGKLQQTDPRDAVKAKTEAKQQKAACGSSAAYDRLKGLLFDQAISEHSGSRANLDTLADYSVVRMQDPVVAGWDPALDITRCRGRFIIELPPGAERAFAGERRLQADIGYTAQAAADGTGFVYRLTGGEAIVAKLAAFNMIGASFSPSPAIDEQEDAPGEPKSAAIARAVVPARRPDVVPTSLPSERRSVPIARTDAAASERSLDLDATEPEEPPVSFSGRRGEATVRAFYDALGTGNGSAASAQVVSEKRGSRAFSPDAISRFYGRLAEPIRLTEVVPLARGTYRVRYRYSAGRSRCEGGAIVTLTTRDARDFIRSIRALGGC